MERIVTDRRIITLMTDFGDSDAYAGIMKGAILCIDPDAKIVDVTHNAPVFRISSAAYLLASYYKRFPAGTVHCAVVDPGVGGKRACIVVEAGGCLFVLPDNGLISMVVNAGGLEYRAWRIANEEMMLKPVSATFHGRDIFAPTAAKLAMGTPPESVGPEITDIDLSAVSAARRSGNKVSGVVVHVDRFGNYITNIGNDVLAGFDGETIIVKIGDLSIMGISRTFSDKAPGDFAVYPGSCGYMEIGVNKGSAIEMIGRPVGTRVLVRGKEKLQ